MCKCPLISIIIPAYNAATYIDRCISSVLKQSYHNIEVIIVNDGSTDNTQAVIDNLAEQDSRIKVIDTPNGGVSKARNTGISFSHGDYIAFADADDWLHPMMIETLYNLCSNNDADMSMCSRTNVTDGNVKNIDTVNIEPLHFYNGVVNINQLASQFDLNVVWNKLIRRSLFDGLEFPTGISYGEDLYMSLDILARTKHIVYIPEGLYYYFVNTSSASYNLSEEKLQSDITVKTKLYEYMRRKGADLIIPFDFLFGAYVKAYSLSDSKSHIRRQYNKFFLTNISVTMRRIKCIMFFICPGLYYKLK